MLRINSPSRTLIACGVLATMLGCGTPGGNAPRTPERLNPGFDVATVSDLDVALVFPNTKVLPRGAAEELGSELHTFIEKRWGEDEVKALVWSNEFSLGDWDDSTLAQIRVKSQKRLVLVAELRRWNEFASPPKARLEESGGIRNADGTYLLNPSICSNVEVRCGLLDSDAQSIVWADRQRVGPFVDGRAMGQKHVTRELVEQLVRQVLSTFPEQSHE